MSDPPPRRPSPKRGAFPTPKSEIADATPFVPDAEREDADTEAAERAASDNDGD